MRGVGELLAAPNHCSGLLVQRDHCSFRAPGGHQYLFSINHRRFGIPPIRANSTEILHQIFPPALLAGRRFHADKIAPLTKLKNELALHGWRARFSAWSVGRSYLRGICDRQGALAERSDEGFRWSSPELGVFRIADG